MGLEERYFTYIVASKSRVLHTGVTGNLERRIAAHKRGEIDGFSKQYRCTRLVSFGGTSDVRKAIAMEKRIKNWRRQWEIKWIERANPNWRDLAEDWGLGDSETSSE